MRGWRDSDLLRNPRLAILLIDLRTPDEETTDIQTAHLRFDIGLLLASFPASMMNQISADLGIPNRFRLNSSRFRHQRRTS